MNQAPTHSPKATHLNRLRPPLQLGLGLTFFLGAFTPAGWTQPISTPTAAPTVDTSVTPPAEEGAHSDVTSASGSASAPVAPDTSPREAKPTGPPPPPPVAEMKCAPEVALIAQPVTCLVTITHPSTMTVQVSFPIGAERGEAILPTPQEDGQLLTQRAFILRNGELNKPLRVKGIKVTWDAIGGHHGVVKVPDQKIPTRAILLGVNEPLPRDFDHPRGQRAEREDESPEALAARAQFWNRHAPPSLTEPNWTLIFLFRALAIGLIGVGFGWLFRRWAEARAARRAPYVDPRSAHEIAYDELYRLAQERLIEGGEFKTYSQRLSEIMRAYFGKRYGFMGLEMTSDELRDALKSEGLNMEAHLVLEDYLSDTDLIKFADLSTSAQALEEMARRARRLIELTRDLGGGDDDEPIHRGHLGGNDQPEDQAHSEALTQTNLERTGRPRGSPSADLTSETMDTLPENSPPRFLKDQSLPAESDTQSETDTQTKSEVPNDLV